MAATGNGNGRNRLQVTKEHADLRDQLLAEIVPPGDLNQAECGAEFAAALFAIATGDDDERGLAADLLMIYAGQGSKQPIKNWWIQEHGARATINVVIPNLLVDQESVIVRRKDFQPLRGAPERNEFGTRTGAVQTSFLITCSRELALAMIDEILRDAAETRVREAAAQLYRRQLLKHPDAATVAEACERDGIDPYNPTIQAA